MTDKEFADILKEINQDLQAIKIYNLFHTSEVLQSKAISDIQNLSSKIAKIRKSLDK